MRFSFFYKNNQSTYDRLLLLIIVLTTPLLFLGGHFLPDTEQFKSLWNLGHIPFSFVAILFINSRINLRGWKRGVWLFLCVLVFSVVIELVQSTIGREASINDIVRNFIGAGLGWFWLQPQSIIVWLGRLAVVFMLVAEFTKTGKLIYGDYLFNEQLPMISNFEHSFDQQRWRGEIEVTDEVSSDGSYSLRAVLGPNRFANIELHGEPQDWSTFSSLSFDLYYEPSENMKLMMRIHDEEHAYGPYRWRFGDRFNLELELNQGWNHFEVPLLEIKNAPTRRQINLYKIANLQFFVENPAQEQIIYLDNLRLN